MNAFAAIEVERESIVTGKCSGSCCSMQLQHTQTSIAVIPFLHGFLVLGYLCLRGGNSAVRTVVAPFLRHTSHRAIAVVVDVY